VEKPGKLFYEIYTLPPTKHSSTPFFSISKNLEDSNSFETVDSERLIEAIKLSPLQYDGKCFTYVHTI